MRAVKRDIVDRYDYSVVVVISGRASVASSDVAVSVVSSEVTVSLVSCTRPLSLFTGLVLVGEMERPW